MPTADLLEERRSRLRNQLQQLVFDNPTNAGGMQDAACSCAWAERHYLAYTEALRGANLQPRDMLRCSIAQVLERLQQMKEPVVSQTFPHCGYRWHHHPDYRASRDRQLKHVMKDQGLCLDCVRSTVEVKRECRIKHS